jgi:hypothetical protein
MTYTLLRALVDDGVHALSSDSKLSVFPETSSQAGLKSASPLSPDQPHALFGAFYEEQIFGRHVR